MKTESTGHIDVLSNDGWESILTWLPKNVDEKMRETGAFTRSRKIKKPTDLLRIALAYPVLHKSLPDLSRWMVDFGKAYDAVGDTAVVCGNLDPVSVIQNLSAAEVEEKAAEQVRINGGKKFILSGGCEITVNTPAENLKAMSDAVGL